MSVSDARDLALLLKTHKPLIAVETDDEARALTLVRAGADGRVLFVWNAAQGLRRDGEAQPVYGTGKLDGCLDHIAASSATRALYALCVVVDLFDDRERVAKLLALWDGLAAVGSSVVLVGPEGSLPQAVRKRARTIKLAPPSDGELYGMVNSVLAELRQRMPVRMDLDAEGAEALIAAMRGLSLHEARHVVARAIVEDGRLSSDDLAFVVREKRASVERSGVLEFCDVDIALDAIVGLERLKRWLAARAVAFSAPERARAFGLKPPRGLLLIGVQGCGKSASAKAIAAAFSLPLLRLDPSRIYDKYVGESEKNLRRALALSERMAPAVLWIDELEKVMGRDGSDDGGVSTRLLGAFLTWLQERRAPVFVIATANDVSRLPPELLRKGRFDETFFLDLPTHATRAAIFAQKLRERSRDPRAFDLEALAMASEGFSGAELEEAVTAALYAAFSEGVPLAQRHIADELEATQPLSILMAEPVAALRAWAVGRAQPADD